MNRTLVMVAAAILVVGAGAYFVSSGSKNDAAMMEKEAMAGDMKKNDAAMMEKEAMAGDEMKKNDASGAETMDKNEAAMMDKKGDAMQSGGSYEPYSADKITMASGDHDVVLFFRAGWCPTCRALDADIRARLKDIPASLTILDVNYDNSTELKKKYGVTYQHTFVQVDARGTMVKKWTGSPTLAALVAEVK